MAANLQCSLHPVRNGPHVMTYCGQNASARVKEIIGHACLPLSLKAWSRRRSFFASLSTRLQAVNPSRPCVHHVSGGFTRERSPRKKRQTVRAWSVSRMPMMKAPRSPALRPLRW